MKTFHWKKYVSWEMFSKQVEIETEVRKQEKGARSSTDLHETDFLDGAVGFTLQQSLHLLHGDAGREVCQVHSKVTLTCYLHRRRNRRNYLSFNWLIGNNSSFQKVLYRYCWIVICCSPRPFSQHKLDNKIKHSDCLLL